MKDVACGRVEPGLATPRLRLCVDRPVLRLQVLHASVVVELGARRKTGMRNRKRLFVIVRLLPKSRLLPRFLNFVPLLSEFLLLILDFRLQI